MAVGPEGGAERAALPGRMDAAPETALVWMLSGGAFPARRDATEELALDDELLD